MAQAVPIIYTSDFTAARLRLGARLICFVFSFACLGALIVVARLTPSPSGVGTHTEMGFNRCEFHDRTGLPCPTCGMTTSVAWFARGNIVASFYIQPMGMIAALLTAAGFWVALYMGISGKPALRLLQTVPYRYYLIPLLTLAVLAWGWKMFLQLQHLDGWP